MTGKGNYTGKATGSFSITAMPKVDISGATASAGDQTYMGSALEPAVTVRLGSKTLASGTDYTVAYANNTNVGTATVTATGKGNYAGTAKKSFAITPRALTDLSCAPSRLSTRSISRRSSSARGSSGNGSVTWPRTYTRRSMHVAHDIMLLARER